MLFVPYFIGSRTRDAACLAPAEVVEPALPQASAQARLGVLYKALAERVRDLDQPRVQVGDCVACLGVLAGLLCCEMLATRSLAGQPATLGEQLQQLFVKVGSFYPLRENFRLTEDVKAKFTKKLREEPREFSGRKVAEVVRTDGL